MLHLIRLRAGMSRGGCTIGNIWGLAEFICAKKTKNKYNYPSRESLAGTVRSAKRHGDRNLQAVRRPHWRRFDNLLRLPAGPSARCQYLSPPQRRLSTHSCISFHRSRLAQRSVSAPAGVSKTAETIASWGESTGTGVWRATACNNPVQKMARAQSRDRGKCSSPCIVSPSAPGGAY